MQTAARDWGAIEPERAGAAAFRTFFRIAEAWELTAEEQMTLLGIASRSTYYKWRHDPPTRLSPDLLERLSYLFGIYKDLQVLLPEPAAAEVAAVVVAPRRTHLP